VTVWQKPPASRKNQDKLGWDAGDHHRSARDHHRSAIVMLCASKEYIPDPTMAEVVAAWRAVELACRLAEVVAACVQSSETVRRVANNATHCLAKLALVQRIWRHDFLRV
jgi:hypothetical protein